METAGITKAQRNRLRVGVALATLWSMALLYVLSRRTSGVAQVLTFVGMIATIVAPVYASGVIPKVPPIGRQLAGRIVVAVLVLNSAITFVWGAMSAYDHFRPIDVTAKVDLRNNLKAVHGTRVESDIDTSAVRDAIDIAFKVTEHYPEQGVCVPYTTMKVTATVASHPTTTATARADQPITLAYPPSTQRLHLDIVVINERDRNCAVDIWVSSAKLVN